MTIDMYSDKVAEASALICEFAKVDYFHYFARDPESSLEEFIAMLDQAEGKGRQSQAARIAELERQLAEASAPAVAQQPVAYIAQLSKTSHKSLTWSNHGGFVGTEYIPLYTAPQAADTDKVRDKLHSAIMNLPAKPKADITNGVKSYDCAYNEGHRDARHAAAELVAAMAAQAPVREVPGWKLVPIEPTEGMLAQYQEFIRAGLHYMDVTIWKAMLAAAPLPAAPVQQEGDHA